SLFTIRAGLAPIIVPAGLSSRYLAAVEEGTRMNTQPMVELLAECLDNALRELIGLAGGA
ncbi:MAG TPA: hypothetical protein VJX67_24975, partial [Blastocatellia bacterium]|nr:hypothetical protein [Blastocatellia bacterium]